MKLVFLTNSFYSDYSACAEMEKKLDRPYVSVVVKINNLTLAIPLRSNIHHKYVVWTDKENNCGLDLSKAVIITNEDKYIDNIRNPQIRQKEHDVIKVSERRITIRMENYITKYKNALSNTHIKENDRLCKYSTMQYFHNELDI